MSIIEFYYESFEKWTESEAKISKILSIIGHYELCTKNCALKI